MMQDVNKTGLGLWSLVCLGVSSIIGSGWLFSAYKTAKYAGGGAIFVWLAGAVVILLLALIIAEISTLYPKVGLFGRVLAISHNKDMGYITALANWFGTVAVIPTEAMATIQYLAKAVPDWNPYLFLNEDLTSTGLLIVTGLVGVYALLNFWGARYLARSNNILTFFKVLVPVITSVAIIYTVFHPGNFTAVGGTLLPYGVGSIVTAIMSGGIIYAFNGFQSIANFCSEAKNPGRNIPLALILSVLVGLVIYLLLQVAFIGGVRPEALANGGWNGLVFQSPILELASLLGLHVIALLLYADAVISPSGTGIVYTGATSRMLTAMSQEKQAPDFFGKMNEKFNFSRRSLGFNLILSLILLWFFRSWESLMIIVSLFHVVSYLACPVALMRLRLTESEKDRPFKLWFAPIICPLFFVLLTILFCLAPEKNLILVCSVLVICYSMYIFISNQSKWADMKKAFKQSYHLVLYFVVLTGLGFLENPQGGGLGLFSDTTYYVIVSIVGLIFYSWLVYFDSCEKTCSSLSNTSST